MADRRSPAGVRRMLTAAPVMTRRMVMDAHLWQRADQVFNDLLDLPAEHRDPALAALGLDPVLVQCVQKLLHAHTGSGVLDAPLATPAGAALSGRQLGAWQLHEEIGRGGSGVVFRATASDGVVTRQAAVKVLPFASIAAQEPAQLRDEQAILARLHHPHIVPLLDAGVAADGTPWLAMPLLRGQPIDRWCDHAGLSLRRRILLFLDVAAAVAHAHQNLVIHRDLKPSNVWIEEGEVRLLDFGIARLLGVERAHTATWLRALTPEYASPEQFRGAPASTTIDIYGLGALLYRLLTGQPVRERHDAPDREPLPPSVCVRRQQGPSSLARQLRGDLDAILLRALALDPQQRYPTVSALADDLRRWLKGAPVLARPPSRLYLLGRFLARHRLAVLATGLVLLAVAGGVIATVLQARRAQQEAQRAATAQQFLLELFGAADPDLRGTPVTDVRQLLAAWPDKVRSELATEPALQAELLLVAGGAYARLGESTEARTLLAEASRLVVRAGSPALLAGRVARERAEVETNQERHGLALPLLDEAIAELERADGPGALPQRFHALLDRANAQRALADLKSSERDLERAAALLPQLPVTDPWPAARLQYLHGLNLLAQEHADAALLAFTRALELAGPSSVRAIPILSKQGRALLWLGRAEEATAAYARALELSRRAFAPDSVLLATALHNMGFALYQQGFAAEAEPLFRDALRIQAAQGSSQVPTLAQLARVLLRLGRGEEALPLHEQAYAHSLAELGPDHPTTIYTLLRAATAYADVGRADAAWQRTQDALRMLRNSQAKDAGPLMRNVGLQRAAMIAVKVGRPDEALDLFEEARRNGPPGPEPAEAGWEIRALLALGRASEAAALTQRLRADVLAMPAAFADNRSSALAALAAADHANGDLVSARRMLALALQRKPGVERFAPWLEAELERLQQALAPASGP